MKMKLMLAVAMSHDAKLLILDEPTSGLDPVAHDELLSILQVSTHITSDLERIADYITLIDHGRIFYTGTKDGLAEHFCIVKGSKTDLTQELKKKMFGFSITSAGFTGMLPSSELNGQPSNVVTESPFERNIKKISYPAYKNNKRGRLYCLSRFEAYIVII